MKLTRITDKCSFDLAIRRLSGSGCTIGSLVRSILDKTIVPISKDKGIGLKQYCFDVRDVDQLMEKHFKGDEEILTVLDVAIVLRIKQHKSLICPCFEHGTNRVRSCILDRLRFY